MMGMGQNLMLTGAGGMQGMGGGMPPQMNMQQGMQMGGMQQQMGGMPQQGQQGW